jgi:hypothetical protein
MVGVERERPPSRAFVWLERTLLGVGMTVVAAVMDRVLTRMLRSGPVQPAPRTAAGPRGDGVDPAAVDAPAEAELTPPAKKVADQPGG